MNIIDHPSPNHGPRREGPVDILVIHYTECDTDAQALKWLTDPDRETSCHYLVGADDSLYQLVKEDRRAWHAGRACWAGNRDVNSRSIGIEVVNGGIGEPPYPDQQIQCLIQLCQDILRRHPIPPNRVLGHSDVAPDRKQDPGAHFPWQQLAAAGIGLWPEPIPPSKAYNEWSIQQMLADFGYCIRVDGVIGPRSQEVIAAFQRHFRPRAVTGRMDDDTLAILLGLDHPDPAKLDRKINQ